MFEKPADHQARDSKHVRSTRRDRISEVGINYECNICDRVPAVAEVAIVSSKAISGELSPVVSLSSNNQRFESAIGILSRS